MLFNIKSSKDISLDVRRALTQEKIKKLQQFVMLAAKINDDPEDFKIDVENSIYHIYGDHLCCRERYCNVVGHLDAHLKSKLTQTDLIYYLKGKSKACRIHHYHI